MPLFRRLLSDQLTPVMAYRCLVKENDVDAPSFLLESVVNGDQQGRYSFVGAMPAMEIIATKNKVTVLNHAEGTRRVTHENDPMDVSAPMRRPCNAHGGVSARGTPCGRHAARMQQVLTAR